MMKASDLRALSDQELAARIQGFRRALFDHTIRHQTQQLENTSMLKSSRRDLARALTVARERSRKG